MLDVLHLACLFEIVSSSNEDDHLRSLDDLRRDSVPSEAGPLRGRTLNCWQPGAVLMSASTVAFTDEKEWPSLPPGGEMDVGNKVEHRFLCFQCLSADKG